MARLIAHLIRKLDPHRDRRGGSARLLASVTVLALVLGSVSPGWALAVEAESEGEGGGGGATPPGLGNPGLEPGGPETVLEELPGSGGGEESEGGAEEGPVEVEPPQEVPVPEAAPGVEEPPASEPPVPTPSPPAVATPAPPSPGYAPAPAPPSYETSPPPTAQQPVENEAIVAPTGSGEPSHTSTDATQPKVSPPASPPIEEPAAPSPTPTEPAPNPSAVLAPDPGARGPGRIPAGRTSYTVHPGDCLWSIAEALLPPGAEEAQVAAEVARLWHLNAGRIGTGDPNLILVGTVLRLA